MPVVRYGEPLSVLVAVKGHPFDRTAFGALFDEMDGVAASFVDQPAAQALMNPDGMAGFDALVLYDMPGLDFAAKDPPGYVMPDARFREGFRALLESGKGIVALHHAIAGWPAWPDYADYLGGAFLYKPGALRGAERSDSGYRHFTPYEAVCAAQAHPVLAGVPARFALTDELYLYNVFADDVTPLLLADFDFTAQNFYSATAAVQGGRMYCNKGWRHAAGSNIIGWTKRAVNSPLVYLQPGDGPSVYSNPHYRRMLRNAIAWVASPEARG